MAEKFSLFGTRQKYAGIFSLSSYYSFIYDLFRRKGFVVYEDKYRLKKVPGEGELELFWTAFKDIDSYSRIEIWAKTLIVRLDKKEVTIEGVPVVMDKGDVELEMKVSIVTDYNNKWEANPFLRSVKTFYDKYIYKPKFQEIEKIAGGHLYFVENSVKEFFKMESF